MNTVTFTNKNSYSDFGLLLQHKEIGEAEPRTNYIEVPARDGQLDLTEAFGEVKYKNRTHVFPFSYVGTDANWQSTMSALNNYINGQKHNIYCEEDYYWVGRCFVSNTVSSKGIRKVTITCDCEPYKKRLTDTVIDVTASGTAVTRTILNDRKTVTPHIKVMSGTPTLSWTDAKTGTSFTNALTSTFDNKILDFKFYEGTNAFTVSGTGSIKLTYREASL